MKLVGLMPVRNEDWVLGLSLRVALMWCDEVVVLLHACTDQSTEIVSLLCAEYHPRITPLIERGGWDEMRHRQLMLETARRIHRATHIAIVDADEILTGDLSALGPYPWHNTGRHPFIGLTAGQGEIVQLPLYNLRGGIHRYHSNGIWGNRIVSLAFADDLPLHWWGDKFHHREPEGSTLQPYRPIQQGSGGVMHLWGANEPRLIAKHALYKVTERLRWPDRSVVDIDREYSLSVKGDPQRAEYGTPDTWTYADVPAAWWKPYEQWMNHLHLDAEPWQEAEVRRLVAEHGREKFAGLDLFGVA